MGEKHTRLYRDMREKSNRVGISTNVTVMTLFPPFTDRILEDLSLRSSFTL